MQRKALTHRTNNHHLTRSSGLRPSAHDLRVSDPYQRGGRLQWFADQRRAKEARRGRNARVPS